MKSLRSLRYVLLAALVAPALGSFSLAGEAESCRQALLQVKQWLCEMRKAPVVTLDVSVKHNGGLPFVRHAGSGRFDSALAMNVRYEPVAKLREQVSSVLGLNLDFFRGWDPKGEAHVTVVTPVEYCDVLRPHVSIDRIGDIAQECRIQEASLKIYGIGSGRVDIGGKIEQTFFLIVESEELLRVRQRIHEAYVAGGGRADGWDPRHFFPHVTIGYTKRDLHEADGVIKDVLHSLDPRFNLSLIGSGGSGASKPR